MAEHLFISIIINNTNNFLKNVVFYHVLCWPLFSKSNKLPEVVCYSDFITGTGLTLVTHSLLWFIALVETLCSASAAVSSVHYLISLSSEPAVALATKLSCHLSVGTIFNL